MSNNEHCLYSTFSISAGTESPYVKECRNYEGGEGDNNIDKVGILK